MDGLLSSGMGGGLLGGMTEEEANRALSNYIQTVPFGSQIIGGAVRPVANYGQSPMGPSMPATSSMAMPQASNPFMAALQYQSNLPGMIRGFNPADVPATYQQVAPMQRLDWSKVTIPQWLQDAINRDKAKTMTPAEETPAVRSASSSGE